MAVSPSRQSHRVKQGEYRMPPEEMVQFALPLSAPTIHQYSKEFQEQFHCHCYLYVKGRLLLSTGEYCIAPTWLPVVRPDDELDLLGIGDHDISCHDEELTWVAPTSAAFLLLSTIQLGCSSIQEIEYRDE